MTRTRTDSDDRQILALILLGGVVGAAALIWPAVDRVLLTAITGAFLAGAVGVLGYVAWAGWTQLLTRRRRRRAQRRGRVRS